MPEYDQPPIPGPDYMWTPGYWSWNNVEYYWVPGTWILPPQPGLLWTPGYWGFANGAYIFHRGYWGPHVGFYGGVAYGFGYTGVGFEGGHWDKGAFYYNRSVTNLGNVNITKVYDKTVVNTTANRVSYNGGSGGVAAKPTPEEEAAAREPHTPPTRLQTENTRAASMNGDLFQSNNHGKPGVAATMRPGVFKGPDVVPSKASTAAPTNEEKQPSGEKPEVKTPPPAEKKEMERKPPVTEPNAQEKRVPSEKPEMKTPAQKPSPVEKREMEKKPPVNEPRAEEKRPSGEKPEMKMPAEKPQSAPQVHQDKPRPAPKATAPARPARPEEQKPKRPDEK